MDIVKGVIDKVASRKLAVKVVAGAAAATGTIELTWLIRLRWPWLISQGRRWWILGMSEARYEVKKTEEQQFKALPQFCF